MKTSLSLTASSRQIRSTYHSRNCPPPCSRRQNHLGQDVLGALAFAVILAGLVLLLLL